jgi:hypothetical protein
MTDITGCSRFNASPIPLNPSESQGLVAEAPLVVASPSPLAEDVFSVQSQNPPNPPNPPAASKNEAIGFFQRGGKKLLAGMGLGLGAGALALGTSGGSIVAGAVIAAQCAGVGLNLWGLTDIVRGLFAKNGG